MVHTRMRPLQSLELAACLVGSSLTFWSCSGKKSENASENSTEATMTDTTAASDSSVFGRQGDTTNNALNAPQQAPPDSGDRGAAVPAEVKVTPKN
ncbi:hypothetical protein [Spirosoma sp.]|uniref:hypothetical protein n=1 Tax=Spirosoma sp. TaxID=1899569 RepID=UPI0026296DA4|nr:hypothetical protein [Spirosoma sp.]MCX6218157.1 hypothetical protein [Spirosoma sp.]